MNILSVNSGCFGSTGTIMLEIMKSADSTGINCYFAYPHNREFENKSIRKNDTYIITKPFFTSAFYHLSKLVCIEGLLGCFGTLGLIRFIKKHKIDIIHLHNLHSAYVNLGMFFKFIKKHNIKVIWTLHDCWSFTGHCPHFIGIGCDKWKTGCHSCPQYKAYPESIVDNSKLMYKLKKKWFSGVSDMTVVTPSQWLADLVKQSFLKEYPVKVINNGIDLDVFKPAESNFREKYGLSDKKIILGVAFPWSERKGLDAFLRLAERLDESERIVLVGVSENQKAALPGNIIGIGRTESKTELAEIYTAADVFVNPTKEDNFPTVNIEALACGTPVVTFNTGGSGEIPDKSCGYVTKENTAEELLYGISLFDGADVKEYCINRAKCFSAPDKFNEYVRMYSDDKKD